MTTAGCRVAREPSKAAWQTGVSGVPRAAGSTGRLGNQVDLADL